MPAKGDQNICPPRALLELATAYQRSKVLFAFLKLELPVLLAAGPLPLDEISDSIGVHVFAARHFLNACVALGLIERSEDRFGIASPVARFLVPGSPQYLGEYLMRHEITSQQLWAALVERLRGWSPGITSHTNAREADVLGSLRAQHSLARVAGAALAGAFDFAPYRRLLDIGGGTGAMSIAICERYPELRAVILDVPEVLEYANALCREDEALRRIELIAGDFHRNALPFGFDVALLANVLSLSTADANQRLLEKIYRWLPDGGAVILSGWMLDENSTGPTISALFSLEDICWEAPDVEHSHLTYVDWLERAGFVEIESRFYCWPVRMVVGRKPR